MSDLVKGTITQARMWRMAIFWFILFSINSLCTCIVSAMAGSVWANLGSQEKFTVVVAIIGNWTGTIIAFVSKAARKIEEGKEPFDDTAIIKKTDITKST
ncbi:MAG: hypothetical protein KGL39_10245 [Patescibacteria group bacterium]|nr:hypothetical protein [Patescibacteria group bacterium]